MVIFSKFWIWPCIKDAAVDLELLHEALVGLDDGPAILHVGQRHIQWPALLLHGVSDHCGPRARNAHLTVHQDRFSTLPATQNQKTFTQRLSHTAGIHPFDIFKLCGRNILQHFLKTHIHILSRLVNEKHFKYTLNMWESNMTPYTWQPFINILILPQQ